MSDLSDVEKLLDLKFQRSKASIAAVLQRENTLRFELSKLTQQAVQVDAAGCDEMRTIGADVIWKAWVGRMRTKLNLELAQTLAQKEMLLKNVRLDFGRLSVCNTLRSTEKEKIDKKVSQAALKRIIDSAVKISSAQ